VEKEREDEQITKPVLFEQEKERSTVGGADMWDTVVVGAGGGRRDCIGGIEML
jgi:hypothetical protein